MRRHPSLFLAALIFLVLAISPARAQESPLRHTRVIAIGAPSVEIVCALGLEDKLIARSSWDSFPHSILHLPDIGNPFQPDIERLASLKPDIVLMDSRLGSLSEHLERCGIEVLPVNAYNPSEIIPAVRNIAKFFKVEKRGSMLVAALCSIAGLVDTGLSGLSDHEKKKGLLFTGSSDLFCTAPESGCSLLEDAGASNLAAGMGHPFPLISQEVIQLAKPDFLLVPIKANTEADRQKSAFFKRMKTAIPKSCRVLFLEEGLTFGLRSFLGTLRLATELYPSRFQKGLFDQTEQAFLMTFFPRATTASTTRP